MLNKQRQRATNIIRCIKKRFVINILRSETRMVDQIERFFKFEKEPVFITYKSSKPIILDSLTLKQILKMEFEGLTLDLRRGKLNFLEYNNKLNFLFKSINQVMNSHQPGL
jgi:hypothetical protein